MSRVSLAQAGELLDLSGRPGARHVSPQLVKDQLRGAVAAHNLMEEPARTAYVADAVGTGKTLVACGALALLRHRLPGARALVIAPRQNLQYKWKREMELFAASNVRYSDLRTRGFHGSPVRPVLLAHSLRDLLDLWAAHPEADVVARLSSFQLGFEAARQTEWLASWRAVLGGERGGPVQRTLDLAEHATPDRAKLLVAQCVNRLLPSLDVLVVDEAHNLKGGAGPRAAARNQVLRTVLGHAAEHQDGLGYGRRTDRVLMLSATPVEDDPRHLARQLEVLGCSPLEGLDHVDPDERRRVMGTRLFRRVTKMRVAGVTLTKNQYRQEWREGGFEAPDQPLVLADARAELTFALVQRRVHDAMGSRAAGNRNFQIGMLTSFESLAESTSGPAPVAAATPAGTAAPTAADPGAVEAVGFDDEEQNRQADEEERRGLDADGVRELVRSHIEAFGRPPVHPKMDGLADRLVEGMLAGRKALVFTRRVASVDEALRDVNALYDARLHDQLRRQLPGMEEQLDRLVTTYRTGDPQAVEPDTDERLEGAAPGEVALEEVRGGTSLFSWLFRAGPAQGWLTGQQLGTRLRWGGSYDTFFEDNVASALLDCRPEHVLTRAVHLTGHQGLAEEVDARAQQYLGLGQARPLQRFRAAQYALLEVLSERATGPARDGARAARAALPATVRTGAGSSRVTSVVDDLARTTLPVVLREHAELCARVWDPELPWRWRTVEDFQRRQRVLGLLAAACRFDHAALDLWMCEVRRVGALDLAGHTWTPDVEQLARDLCQELDRQRTAGGWGGFEVLRRLSADGDVVAEVNGLRDDVDDAPAWVGNRAPAVGMSGQVSRTAVAQFRTPGYPLVLVSTDLLQEGEDLHTFCDEIHHYGIAFMPSALEQRTGRVDRVNSLTERRLAGAALNEGLPHPEDRLQVLYPHVSGTYEELQVDRVLERLDRHVRLLHQEFGAAETHGPRLDPRAELLARPAAATVEPPLGEPYPVLEEWLVGDGTPFPVVDRAPADRLLRAFERLRETVGWQVSAWSSETSPGQLLAECVLPSGRRQSLDLRLTSVEGRPAVRVVSPVGRVDEALWRALLDAGLGALDPRVRLGLVAAHRRTAPSFTLTAEALALVREDDLTGRLTPVVEAVLRVADVVEERLLAVDASLDTFTRDLLAEVSGA